VALGISDADFSWPQRSRFVAVNADSWPRAKVSLIIPTLEEAENLRLVLPSIPTLVDELVVVDGGSTDGSTEVVRQLRPDAVIVSEPRRGKGCALRAGFAAASGDILVMMDADGSMDPNDIVTFVAALHAGADVAKGSRFVQGGGSGDLTFVRTVGNLMLTQAVRLAFGGRYSDLCYGYMAFWRHVLPTFVGGADGFEVETFLNVRALAAGLRVVEVATYERPRIHGESKLRTFRDGSRVLWTIARERRQLRRARSGLGVPRPVVHTIGEADETPRALAPTLHVSKNGRAHLREAER
jgi:glycosyltransferase involved in cell wall biosynthesis